jgi:hypothetical protein
LNIEQFFQRKFKKSKLNQKNKLGQALDIVGKPLMGGIF